MTSGSYGLHDDTIFWIKRLSSEAFSSLEKTLKEHEISVTEWSVLMSLLNGDAINVAELSRFIEVDKASISRTVSRLEERGFVSRKPGEDRRSLSLILTRTGQTIAKKLAKKSQDNEESFMESLSNQERVALKKVIKKLLQSAGVSSLGGAMA
jgi:DNA-binding MarR family transcriptional regulator